MMLLNFNPVLLQVANALVKSKKNPNLTTLYKRIKTHHDYREAIIAIYSIIPIVIWHIRSDLKPYTPKGFLDQRLMNESKILTNYISVANFTFDMS